MLMQTRTSRTTGTPAGEPAHATPGKSAGEEQYITVNTLAAMLYHSSAKCYHLGKLDKWNMTWELSVLFLATTSDCTIISVILS